MKNERAYVFDELGLKSFVARLKKVRKKLGVTQEELSNKSGLTLSQIARIETIRVNPSLSTIFYICRGLGIQPSELFEDVDILGENK